MNTSCLLFTSHALMCFQIQSSVTTVVQNQPKARTPMINPDLTALYDTIRNTANQFEQEEGDYLKLFSILFNLKCFPLYYIQNYLAFFLDRIPMIFCFHGDEIIFIISPYT